MSAIDDLRAAFVALEDPDTGFRAVSRVIEAAREVLIERDSFPTDEQVRAAVKAYKAPRLHVNDSQIDREIDMRAALETLL